MNPREKTLTVLVAGLLAVFGLQMIHHRIEDKITKKSDDRDGIQARLDATLDELETADQAAAKLEIWKARSLPKETDIARSLYQQWIGDQLSAAGLNNFTISNQLSPLSSRSAYGTLTVNVNTAGSLDNLIQFLFAFYRADLLHKITSLTTTPSTTDDRMSFSFTLEALIMPDADREDTLPAGQSDQLQHEQLAEYQESIGGRNLFLAYEPPPPPKPPVVRHDPPPPPPKPVFDDATQAYITGIVEREGQLEAWIKIRTTGESLRLNKGESFDIGLMTGQVVDVTLRTVLLKTEDGLVQVGFGQSLREGTPVHESTGS